MKVRDNSINTKLMTDKSKKNAPKVMVKRIFAVAEILAKVDSENGKKHIIEFL